MEPQHRSVAVIGAGDYIGAAIAKKAYAQGLPIREMAQQMTDLTPEQLARLLDPLELTRGGIKGGSGGG